MILFFPQWQGAGQGNRIDKPAHMLMDSLRPQLNEMPVTEIELDPATTLEREDGIWGRAAILRQLTDARARLVDTSTKRVFTVGGDCGIEVVPISYVAARHENFALVWLDGHADLNTTETSPSGTFHGMPLRVLFGEGDPEFTALVPKPLTPQQVVMVGVRDLDPAERDFIQQHNILNFAVGTPDIARRIVDELAARGVQNIYVHVDLDVLDPAEWPHMHYPAPHGFRVRDLVEMIGSVNKSFEIVGMSITEYDGVDGAGLDTIARLLDIFVQRAILEG